MENVHITWKEFCYWMRRKYYNTRSQVLTYLDNRTPELIVVRVGQSQDIKTWKQLTVYLDELAFTNPKNLVQIQMFIEDSEGITLSFSTTPSKLKRRSKHDSTLEHP